MNGKPQDPSTTLRIARLVAATATTLAAILFSAALPAAAGVQEVDDSAGIRARVEQYRTAWNTHDPSALAAFFTEDADFVMGNLPAVHGRRAIRDWWQDYFARQEPERRLTLDVSPVKLIAEDVAVVNVATTTGGHGPEGQELRRRRFRGTWLLQRRGGDWLISAMRGFPQEDDRVVLNASVEAAETLRPQIRAFVAAYEDAWNSHDPSAVSGLYRDDADIMIRNAPLVHGREAIQNWWSTYFSQPRPYHAWRRPDQSHRDGSSSFAGRGSTPACPICPWDVGDRSRCWRVAPLGDVGFAERRRQYCPEQWWPELRPRR
jgi:uncharacterized protein (TIGR02246 family)